MQPTGAGFITVRSALYYWDPRIDRERSRFDRPSFDPLAADVAGCASSTGSRQIVSRVELVNLSHSIF